MGRGIARGGDVIMLRLPMWLRRVLFIFDVKKPSITLCSVIWQIILYLLVVFYLLCYFVLRLTPQEIAELMDRLFVIILFSGLIIVFYTIMYMHSYKNRRRVEQVIAVHFDRNIWRSSSRKIFDEKFKYAEKRMISAISEGKVVIKKGKDIHEKQGYKKGESFSPTSFDPLTKREIYFFDKYCFFYGPNSPGLISDIENDIRNKWKNDKSKKQYWDFKGFGRHE